MTAGMSSFRIYPMVSEYPKVNLASFAALQNPT